MKEIIFLNGKFVEAQDAKLSMLSPGFLCGYALFETLRCVNKKVIYFVRHMERIKNSAPLLGMKLPYRADKIKKIIKRTLELNGFKDNYIRLTIWKDDIEREGISVIIKEYQSYPPLKYKQGLRVCVSGIRQDTGSFLCGIKTANRISFEAAYNKAQKNNFDETIILNNLGYISEASRSNIFFVKNGDLFTPSLECGCLKGITRQAVFDLAKKHGIGVNEGRFTLDDLHQARESFLTNSLMGIIPLTYVEGKRVGGLGKTTAFFMDKYNLLDKREF